MRFRIRLRRFSRPVLALMISLCLVTTGSSRSPSDGEYDPLSIHSAFMVTGKRLVASGDYPEIDLDRIYLEDLLTRFGYFRQPLGEDTPMSSSAATTWMPISDSRPSTCTTPPRIGRSPSRARPSLARAWSGCWLSCSFLPRRR